MWTSYKRCDIYVMRIAATEKEADATFEIIMAENLPKLMAHTKPQIWEVRGTLSRINAKNKYKNN